MLTKSLADLFSWSEEEPDFLKIKMQFLGYQSRNLASILAESSSTNPEHTEGIDCFFNLNEKSTQKILLAPEFTYRYSNLIKFGPTPTLNFLATTSRIEAFHNTQIQPPKRKYGGWSALGDRYLPFITDEYDEISSNHWLSDPTTPYEAKESSSDIVIDYLSPYAKRKIHANNFRKEYSATLQMDLNHQNQVNKKVIAAINFLQDHQKSANNFVHSFVYSVMPREDKAIDGYQGGSSRHFIGRVNLINPQIPEICADNIVSSIVHESIHIFLYILEIWREPCNDLDRLYKANVVSPWTNNNIHLLAFIHASFVWYGLAKLWISIKQDHNYSSHVSNYYIDNAIKGFSSKRYNQILQANKDCIHPELYLELANLPRNLL